MMIQLFKLRTTPYDLGHLESKVMEILWARAECNVRDVVELLSPALASHNGDDHAGPALCKKRHARPPQRRAGVHLSGSIFKERMGTEACGHADLSCLVDAAGPQDAALLDKLENKIRMKRIELESKRKP